MQRLWRKIYNALIRQVKKDFSWSHFQPWALMLSMSPLPCRWVCYWLTDWPPLFVSESPRETAVSQPPLIDLIQLKRDLFYLTTHFICIDLWGLILPDFSVKRYTIKSSIMCSRCILANRQYLHVYMPEHDSWLPYQHIYTVTRKHLAKINWFTLYWMSWIGYLFHFWIPCKI